MPATIDSRHAPQLHGSPLRPHRQRHGQHRAPGRPWPARRTNQTREGVRWPGYHPEDTVVRTARPPKARSSASRTPHVPCAQPSSSRHDHRLQHPIDTFVAADNHSRPHSSLRTAARPRSPTPHARTPPSPQPAATFTIASAKTASTMQASSPWATPDACTTSESAELSPEPTACCSSTSSTSASSTQRPENSCASSPSNPPRTVNPSADQLDQRPQTCGQTYKYVGPSVSTFCHSVGLTGFEPATP